MEACCMDHLDYCTSWGGTAASGCQNNSQVDLPAELDETFMDFNACKALFAELLLAISLPSSAPST